MGCENFGKLRSIKRLGIIRKLLITLKRMHKLFIFFQILFYSDHEIDVNFRKSRGSKCSKFSQMAPTISLRETPLPTIQNVPTSLRLLAFVQTLLLPLEIPSLRPWIDIAQLCSATFEQLFAFGASFFSSINLRQLYRFWAISEQRLNFLPKLKLYKHKMFTTSFSAMHLLIMHML